MKSILNHVAILVENIENSVKEYNLIECELGEIDEFPSEGTRELYIGGNNQMGRLLLMQAIGEGPYMNALKKRGPGLHHIAIDVLDVDKFVSGIAGNGWYIHPKSLGFYNSHRQIFLARPGVAVLIEVQERKELLDNNYFIDEIEFPFSEKKLINSLLCKRIVGGKKIKLKTTNDVIQLS